MSKYGIRIKNYEAASIYEYWYGFRNNLDSTNAMLTNSLFKDFLVENGLNVWKEESTRDIICVQFGYGTKDYISSIKKINDMIKNSEDENHKEFFKSIKKNIEDNEEACVKISRNDLRIKFYNEGFNIRYKTYNKKGKVTGEEVIHYNMLYRTPGKAKKGTCMFIRDELYEAARNFLYMGIELSDEMPKIVEMGAYCALITSGIVGKVRIEPEQILTIKDVDAFFKTKVTTVNLDKNGHCYAEDIDGYEVKNTLWDGEALIDSSIFPEWGDGYILLRHHMCKMAAFNTNIELFMREKFGDEYETATVPDMFGNQVRVKDIKLITTDDSFKWLNFGVSYEYWSEWVRKNDCMFGIVKTAHESKLGNVQRMSYQMTNALDINSMPEVTDKSVQYINKLKSDLPTFLDYLRKNSNFSNDYEVLVALCEHNCDFYKTEYFINRKFNIIQSYTTNFKSGRTIQNADNLTIVGSPYSLLLAAVGDNPFDDPTFEQESDCIQCYTDRFDDGEYLAAFRSPFNARNNMDYLHNVKHPYFKKYFNFGKLIIAVNMIGTDAQDRNNGLTKWASVQKCA